MIKKVFIPLLVSVVSFSALACELPRGEVIKVGCTYNCDFFYRFRITMTAWGMGYSTKIINLNKQSDMTKAMSEVDAILLPGGADIDPKYYLDSVSPELQEYTKTNLDLVHWSNEGKVRDPFEYSLVKKYSEDETYKNLPMLGICRGLQMMSVAQGIPLYLDIKTELGIKNRMRKFDQISVADDSLIQSIYPAKSFKGFKLHHQGIRVPYYEANRHNYPLTKVTAYSNDRKIAEAIEYTHRPALGVQYHPERSYTGTSVPVFRWFLTKACEYKKERSR
jgi:gamma-glutamyl-gamma-aminobutyrate hydrolase PuuD